MDVFMSVLIKMSLRGIVIIGVVLLLRLLLKRLRVSHKYIMALWIMVFFFFSFPWKIGMSAGFWDNAVLPEKVRVLTENPLGQDKPGTDGTEAENADAGMTDIDKTDADTNADKITAAANSGVNKNMTVADPAGIENLSVTAPVPGDVPDALQRGGSGTDSAASADTAGQSGEMQDGESDSVPEGLSVRGMLSLLWLAGVIGFLGHMLYSYFCLKRKLQLSILYEDNIWWAEDIDIPMVFGLIHPRIYLPVSMELDHLAYVIAHEKMHIKRRDALLKMIIYVICVIHWFNPFIWIAYILFGRDMEKACDEAVIGSMGRERRKEYAYALLHAASEDGKNKRQVFVAPICFDEGNVKSRIKNIMKYKYTLPGIGAAVAVGIAALSILFLTEAKELEAGDPAQETAKGEEANEDASDEGDSEDSGAVAGSSEVSENLPAFYVADYDDLYVEDDFSLENYYITSRYGASNYYYIDADGVLWGTGGNEFGQLGTGTYGNDEYYEASVRIAEHVVSVDASRNDYFCIYLTESGDLYGVGLNYSGLLLGKGSESRVYSYHDFQKVTGPVLLMTDVVYARAGRECIVALKEDGTAYWWGQYAPATLTQAAGVYENYWKLEEDATNPSKMLAVEPVKIMDNCSYITTGDYTGAAISETGELYTWGFNAFGQCGTPVTQDDFVRTPVKVMDGVKMVWPERVYFNDDPDSSSEYARWETNYAYVTFVLKADDTLLAAGLNLGNQVKTTELNGDIAQTQIHRYSDGFVPVRAYEYSTEYNLQVLGTLKFGMPVEVVERILGDAGVETFRAGEGVPYSEEFNVCLSASYNQFHCYFNRDDELVQITLQEGGSRDGRFVLGMSLSDLEEAIGEAGGTIRQIVVDAPWDLWCYQDDEQRIRYEFYVYEGSVTVVDEKALEDI